MLKKYTLMLIFVIAQISALKSQDIIVLNSGHELKAHILEVEEHRILYKIYNSNTNLTNSFPIDSVFMVIYKNGHREVYEPRKSTDKTYPEKVNNKVLILNDNNFEVLLVKKETVTDKKNKYNTIKATVKVMRNNTPFTDLTIVATQVKNKSLDYDKVNGSYYFKSNITINSDKYSSLFFMKYENFYGKGYGWALSPNFFSDNSIPCSIAFLSQKGYNREVKGSGGLIPTKFPLQECSSLEKRILSASLVWLDINFIKK